MIIKKSQKGQTKRYKKKLLGKDQKSLPGIKKYREREKMPLTAQ